MRTDEPALGGRAAHGRGADRRGSRAPSQRRDPGRAADARLGVRRPGRARPRRAPGLEPDRLEDGAASNEIRESEGLPGAAPAGIYRATVFESGASLGPELFINYRNVECEFAFRLRDGLPIRSAAYSKDEVSAAIDCLLPTLEIGDTVFDDWYGSSAFFGSCLDNGGGAALVCGEPVADWRRIDLPNARIEISLNGQRINEGYGRAAMGHPLTC